MIWERAEVVPIPWQAAEAIWAVSSEDYTRSYHHCESFSGAAFPKGSEEVTYSSNVAANLQVFQSRKAIKSNLSDGVLLSRGGQEGRGVKGLSHPPPDCVSSERWLSERAARHCAGHCLRWLWGCGCASREHQGLRGHHVIYSVIPRLLAEADPSKISYCCCLKLQQGSKPLDYLKNPKTSFQRGRGADQPLLPSPGNVEQQQLEGFRAPLCPLSLSPL